LISLVCVEYVAMRCLGALRPNVSFLEFYLWYILSTWLQAYSLTGDLVSLFPHFEETNFGSHTQYSYDFNIVDYFSFFPPLAHPIIDCV
jgi:hypothetical protein